MTKAEITENGPLIDSSENDGLFVLIATTPDGEFYIGEHYTLGQTRWRGDALRVTWLQALALISFTRPIIRLRATRFENAPADL